MKDEMDGIPGIETARLLLRPLARLIWRTIPSYIFADAEVMRYLPKRDLAPRERAERTITFFNDHWLRRGYGVWAVQTRSPDSSSVTAD